MANFTISEPLFLVPCNGNEQEKRILDDFVRLLEESGAFRIIEESAAKESHDSGPGRPRYDSRLLLLLLLYGFSQADCSLRELQDSCRYDLRFLYLSSGNVPSYTTFCDFINRIYLPVSNRLYQVITEKIAQKMSISILDRVYIDGSKFEANANKYKFRFKSEKRRSNLFQRFCELMKTAEIIVPSETESKKMTKTMDSFLESLKESIEKTGKKVEEIKTGRGIRNDAKERAYVRGNAMLLKMKEYDETESICGSGRNSYYLTDHDATVMCLKEDYYSGLGSNMHAAYNVQYAVSDGLILAILVSQDRSDSRTFPKLLKKIKEMYGKYPNNVCADSGYGSATNYDFIRKEGIGNFVKFATWQKEISGEKPPKYRFVEGKVVCLCGRELTRTENGGKKPRSPRYSFYLADCRGCPYKKYCNKERKNKRSASKIFEIDLETLKSKEEARENLKSVEGIESRVNRSIQAEGSFGIMKQDKGYSRFRRRGLGKTDVEMQLNCIGLNLAKYIRFLRNGKAPEYWKAPAGTKPEEEHEMSRTIKKGGKKAPKKQPNQKAKKYKYKKTEMQ